MFLVTQSFTIGFWIVVGVIALIALLIYAAIDQGGPYDMDEFFESFSNLGWLLALGIFALGFIVYLFITWVWWIMLIIVIGLILIGIIIGLLIYIHNQNDLIDYMASKLSMYEGPNAGNDAYIDDEDDEDYDDEDDYDDESDDDYDTATIDDFNDSDNSAETKDNYS